MFNLLNPLHPQTPTINNRSVKRQSNHPNKKHSSRPLSPNPLSTKISKSPLKSLLKKTSALLKAAGMLACTCWAPSWARLDHRIHHNRWHWRLRLLLGMRPNPLCRRKGRRKRPHLRRRWRWRLMQWLRRLWRIQLKISWSPPLPKHQKWKSSKPQMSPKPPRPHQSQSPNKSPLRTPTSKKVKLSKTKRTTKRTMKILNRVEVAVSCSCLELCALRPTRAHTSTPKSTTSKSSKLRSSCPSKCVTRSKTSLLSSRKPPNSECKNTEQGVSELLEVLGWEPKSWLSESEETDRQKTHWR